ncbi:hypothetical protein J1614_002319 [Plenodomus biglobosus]|nr:hypothetical protein J1614_002319 [Plenodomus biglobosus]
MITVGFKCLCSLRDSTTRTLRPTTIASVAQRQGRITNLELIRLPLRGHHLAVSHHTVNGYRYGRKAIDSSSAKTDGHRVTPQSTETPRY